MFAESKIIRIALDEDRANLIVKALTHGKHWMTQEELDITQELKNEITASLSVGSRAEGATEEMKKFVIYPGNRRYLVNQLGEVKDSVTGKMRNVLLSTGKPCVSLLSSGCKSTTVAIAVIVARTFGIIPMDKSYYSIDFIDGNPNNYRADNLKFVTVNPRHRKVKNHGE